ncbi:MAG TPA: FHA domain-containing protein [Phycisphaerae bacterium]|nr:FHA domain-containing protein [Phycisphaerae bacterium]
MEVKLIMFKESGQQKDFALASEITTVGRKEDCDLRIPLAEVSRKHCQFVLHSDRVVLQDLGSSNGTYVNNKRVAELQLQPGDHVVIGPVVFSVQIDGEPSEMKPVRTRLEHRPRAASMAAPSGDTNLGRTDLSGEEMDPISALEALAASGTHPTPQPEQNEQGPEKES